MLVLAATDGTDLTSVTTWVNFGVLGLVVLALITGRLWTKPSVDRLQEEKDRAIKERERADAQRDAMAMMLQDKLIPVISDFITTTRSLLPVLQQLQQLQQMIPVLQDLVRANDSSEARETRPAPRRRRPPT